MNEKAKNPEEALAPAMSEAERMSRIRDLLMGPVIADQSAKVEQSVERLNTAITDQATNQAKLVAELTARLERLEAEQRAAVDKLQSEQRQAAERLETAQQASTERLQLRLLGLVDALLCDEADLRARINGNKLLAARLNGVDERPSPA
jgi:molecular chaperone GrpE (heat shock protein)